MSAMDYLRRWWEINASFFGKLHRAADKVAGVALVLAILLGVTVFHQVLGISIGIPSELKMTLFWAFLGSAGVFVLAVIVQTLAGLRAFFYRLRIRIWG